ncbi:MAG: SurA N-terminal domain-containing protein [Gammaproteobacteria bacterium]
MLQRIRQWAHGWVAGLVIGLVAIVFVIWGIGANFDELFGNGKSGNPVVLTVGSQQFTQAQLDQNYQATLVDYKNAMAAQHMDVKPEDEARVKELAKQQMIMESVLNQFLGKTGFVVSKDQADAFIGRIPQLQEDGHFSMELYQSMLAQRHLTAYDFLRDMQTRMVFMQASAAIGGSALVLPYEIESALGLIYQTRDIGYTLLDVKDFEKNITITDADLQAYYNGHHSEFTVPAQATIEYITLTRQQIAEHVRKEPVPEAALQALYASHDADFTIPESRHIAHILILVPENATDDERKAKRKEAEDLLERLRAGASFAALAKEHSQDPGSASQGGDLGVAIKGTFDPAFDDAAFSADKDKVVGPVETPFGYHLILVTAIEPAQKEPLSDVSKELSEEWYQTETAKRYDDAVKDLSDMAFQAGTEFSALAKQFELTPAQATLSQDAKSNEGITANAAVIQAAFDKAAYDQKLNSELIHINANEAVVLHTTAYQDSHLKPFDTVKADIEKSALARQAMRLAEEKATAIQAALASGKSYEEVEKSEGIVWKQQDKLDRRNKEVPYEVVVEAFKTPMGDKPALTTAPMLTGVAVIQVKAIYPGKAPEFKSAEEERAFNENLKSQLAEFMARRDFDLFGEFAKRVIIKDTSSQK